MVECNSKENVKLLEIYYIWIIFKSMLIKKFVCLIIILTGLTAYSEDFFYVPDNSDFVLYSRSSESPALIYNKEFQAKLRNNIRLISSAQRITRGSDDPAVLSVSERMRGQLRVLKRQMMNNMDYKKFLNYKESVIGENVKVTQRIRELLLKAGNPILHKDDLDIIQTEIDNMLKQIDMNAVFSTFNKKQVVPLLTTEFFEIDDLSVRDASAGLKSVDNALKTMSRLRSSDGVEAYVKEITIDGERMYHFNLQDSESVMRDLNISLEYSDFVKNTSLYRFNNGFLATVEE